jgi:hypothetical protein
MAVFAGRSLRDGPFGFGSNMPPVGSEPPAADAASRLATSPAEPARAANFRNPSRRSMVASLIETAVDAVCACVREF